MNVVLSAAKSKTPFRGRIRGTNVQASQSGSGQLCEFPADFSDLGRKAEGWEEERHSERVLAEAQQLLLCFFSGLSSDTWCTKTCGFAGETLKAVGEDTRH